MIATNVAPDYSSGIEFIKLVKNKVFDRGATEIDSTNIWRNRLE